MAEVVGVGYCCAGMEVECVVFLKEAVGGDLW